jgi:hypothetical protein
MVVAAAVLVAAVMAATFLLHQRGQDARMLYEERVAWEVAAGRVETLEARGFAGLSEGRSVLAVQSPGWENLEDALCTLEVRPAGDGVHAVIVEVTWKSFRGVARRVDVRTLAQVKP